jgi:hypothetical protein
VGACVNLIAHGRDDPDLLASPIGLESTPAGARWAMTKLGIVNPTKLKRAPAADAPGVRGFLGADLAQPAGIGTPTVRERTF